MATAVIESSATIKGLTYKEVTTIQSALDTTIEPVGGVPAAKTGTLTTRTDNDTGTLTMASGHGFLTSDVIDLFWSTGSRRGMTVGTVAGDSVPIDLGSGDNLPLVNTAITAMKQTLISLSTFVGDNVDVISLFSESASPSPYSYITFLTSIDAVIFSKRLTFSAQGGGGGYNWWTGKGETNPLTGQTVAKVAFSHGDSTGAKRMTATVFV